MRPSIRALKLAFEVLQVQVPATTLNKRIVLQKAVYLAQAAGGDLGYRFSWYERGPYSSDLSEDYYELFEQLKERPEQRAEAFPKRFKEVLERVRRLLEEPKGDLSPETWAELLASVDFVLRVAKLSEEDAKHYMAERKPDLALNFDIAIDALAGAMLLKRDGSRLTLIKNGNI